MLYFRNERRHGTRNLENALFLSHLQPPKDKNSKHLAVLILEFDDVTMKTIYWLFTFASFSNRGKMSIAFSCYDNAKLTFIPKVCHLDSLVLIFAPDWFRKSIVLVTLCSAKEV